MAAPPHTLPLWCSTGGAVAMRSIAILANSYKNGRRCTAGKEVHSIAEGRWHLTDECYRPGTSHRSSHGGIPLHICTDPTTSPPFQLPDIVEIDFAAPAPEAGQPENWTFHQTPWSRVGRFHSSVAARLLDHPLDIWDDPGFRAVRRVAESQFGRPPFLLGESAGPAEPQPTPRNVVFAQRWDRRGW